MSGQSGRVRLSASALPAELRSNHFLPVFPFCARALAAAVFDAAEVRRSRKTLDAAEAAFALVCLFFAMVAFLMR